MLRNFAIASVLFLILSFLLLFFFQRKLIYFPAKQMPSREQYAATDMKNISLTSVNGVKIMSWYKEASPGKPTILYLHGNGGNIGFRMPIARALMNEGFGVFLLEYQGYGGNSGSPSEQNLYADSEAARQFLAQQGVDGKYLVLYGESLGTAVATHMAANHPSCAMILQSPLTSLAAVARFHYPLILIPPWDKYDSLSRIKQIHVPLLIVHGDKDLVVPYEEGRELYDAANQPKEFVSVVDRGHGDLWGKEFYQRIVHFINRYCPAKN